MNNRRVFLLILAIVMLAVMPSCESEKANTGKLLKFNFEKGKEYNYEMIYDLESADIGQKISVGGLYSLIVTNENDGIKTLTVEYKRLKMSMDMRGLKIEMDSNIPSDDDNPDNVLQTMMGKMFSGITGKPFTIKVNEEGKVLEISGFENIIDNMVDSLVKDPDMKMQVTASMKDQFNENAIKDQFGQIFTMFPNKKVNKGDTWEKEISTSGKMAADYLTTYKVKDIEGDQVFLTAKSKISSKDGSPANISGTQEMVLVVDSKTGLVVNESFDQNFEISVGESKMEMTGKGKIKGQAN